MSRISICLGFCGSHFQTPSVQKSWFLQLQLPPSPQHTHITLTLPVLRSATHAERLGWWADETKPDRVEFSVSAPIISLHCTRLYQTLSFFICWTMASVWAQLDMEQTGYIASALQVPSSIFISCLGYKDTRKHKWIWCSIFFKCPTFSAVSFPHPKARIVKWVFVLFEKYYYLSWS